ncbi:MAG TPA: ABC transporter permease [Bryobacteraceae bacterium]|nr:ABC transporter permease [Bryobacteraceae bacterium]
MTGEKPSGPFAGLGPVCRKEFVHVARDPTTIFFALAIPIVQLILFGFAIDTNVRQIPTIVLDSSRTQESRRLIEAFANSDVFEIRYIASSEADLYENFKAGTAKVGIRIPPDYSRLVQEGEQATVQVLADGSDSNITNQAVSTANGVVLQESMRKLLGPQGKPPVEVRPAVLFNPGLRSPNFFVPGMIAILLQMMVIMLTAFSVVRERERGTLDQLWLTPISPLGLMVGKIVPYGLLAFVELTVILTLMRVVFQVPVNGSVVLLYLLSVPFVLTVLGLGLMISTRARSQSEAFQMAMGTLLPSVFLSGYIFLIENMPFAFQLVSRLIPATYFIAILRGIILRGAGMQELWIQAAILTGMGCAAIIVAARAFVKTRA